VGSFSEFMVTTESGVVKIPRDMPMAEAALIGCGVMTGVGAALNTAKVAPGSTVAVLGCGGVGLSAIQGASIGGAGRIIAVDTLPAKLELSRKFGATDTVNASEGDPVAQVKEMTGGGVEYSFEAIGLKKTAEQAFQMLENGGTATVIGMIPVGQMVEVHGVDFLFEKKIQGSSMGSNRFRVDMPRYVDFYLSGKLNLDDMVSRQIKLDQVNDAFEALERGDVARQVIAFE
jgi:S-(hydroxymethyl)glutathione dehydrogenase/alcohol dehydrogenase